MVEFLGRAFFAGPNIHADRSVFAASARASFQNLPAKPGAEEQCRTVFGDQPEIRRIVSDAIASLPDDAQRVALAPAIASRLLEPWLIYPQAGWLETDGAGTWNFIIPADESQTAWESLQFGIAIVIGLETSGAFPQALRDRLVEQYPKLRERLRADHIDQLGRAMIRGARALDIPATVVAARRALVQYGQGRHLRAGMETRAEPAGFIASFVSSQKHMALALLRQHGLPVLDSFLVGAEELAVDAASRLGGPVVIKPADRGKGVGISIGVQSEDEVRAAFQLAAQHSRAIIVERFAEGKDYRLLVVDGTLVAAARREPATVTGDGKRTIAELVAELNADPRRGSSYEKVLDRVPIDGQLDQVLAKQGVSLSSVPETGREVALSLAANTSLGGTASDVTDVVHPENREMVERAARIIGLEVAGVDFLTTDITQSWREVGGALLELNCPAGLRPHWMADPDRDVVTPILRHMFPAGTGRIPTVGFVGSGAAHAAAALLAGIARLAGRTPGMATGQGVVSGTYRVSHDDAATGAAARTLLLDPTIDFGIFEIASASLLQSGMAIDDLDILVALRDEDGSVAETERRAAQAIAARHTRQSVLVEAGDPAADMLAEQIGAAALIRFSKQGRDAIPAAHLAAGGAAAWIDSDAIVVMDETGETRIAMPQSTEAGRRDLLVAAAAAWRAGIATEAIAAGLAAGGAVHNRADPRDAA